MEVALVITLEQIEHNVRTTPPRKFGDQVVWWSNTSCWWTTVEEHLWTFEQVARVRLGPNCPTPVEGWPKGYTDPLGGPLVGTHDFDLFIGGARRQPDLCGKYGLKALEAAYSANGVHSLQIPTPACFRTWDELTEALERFYARRAAIITTLN
jgi:hypothetical protein